MAADLNSMDAALKETWTEDRLEEQIYQDNPFLDEIEKTDRYHVGQQAVTPLHTTRNAGYTALGAAGGTLNAAGQQGVAQAVWQYAHHNQQVGIQGSAIDGTADNSLSVANVIDVEVQGAVDDLRKNLTRQTFLDGSGFISGVLTANSATVQLTVTDGFNAIERGWIYPGQYIDVGTTADGDSLTATPRTVVSVTESATAPTFAISGAALNVTAGTHFVSARGSRPAGTSLEMNGLANLVLASDTGPSAQGSLTLTALGGIAATNTYWNAANADSTVQALTLDLMYQNSRKVQQKTGRSPDYVITGLKQMENFYKLLQMQVRFSSDSSVSAGSVGSAQYAGMSINAHPDCKNEQMFFLSRKNIFVCAVAKPYWVNKIEGGGGILRWIQSSDSYGSKLTYRMQLCTNRRNAHASLLGLS